MKLLFLVILGCLTTWHTGCSRRPEPRLQHLSIEVTENVADVVFDVEVENIGDSKVVIDACEAIIIFTYILPEEEQILLPAKFEHQVKLLAEGDRLKIDPGESATIPIMLLWELAENSPRMLAMTQAQLVLRYDASFGTNTAPVTFVLVTDEPARGLLPDESSADEMKDLLRRFPAQASKGVKQIMQTPE